MAVPAAVTFITRQMRRKTDVERCQASASRKRTGAEPVKTRTAAASGRLGKEPRAPIAHPRAAVPARAPPQPRERRARCASVSASAAHRRTIYSDASPDAASLVGRVMDDARPDASVMRPRFCRGRIKKWNNCL